MLKPAIQQPLSRQELKDLVKFLAYHLGYVPVRQPKAIFCKSAKEYAQLYEARKIKDPDQIDEINKNCPAFFDQTTDTIVFQGYSYHEGIEIPQFIIPMATVVHELIHFFQYTTGDFGTYRIFYEGTNELLSGFLTDDFRFDYKEEVVYVFNIVMELTGHDFWKTIQWMKMYTLHSHKNRLVHREMKRCPTFAKYNQRKLLMALDGGRLDKIANVDTQAVLTRYSLPQIIRMCKKNRKLIQF